MHKLLCSIEYRQQPIASRWKWKGITKIAIKGTEDSIITADCPEPNISGEIHKTVLKAVQIFIQIVSAGKFCGCIIFQETQHARFWSALSQELFAAVGQWNNLAVVMLVLVAAGVNRIWASTGAGSAVAEEERKLEGIEESEKGKTWSRDNISPDDDGGGTKGNYLRDDEDENENMGTEKKNWDERIGCAS